MRSNKGDKFINIAIGVMLCVLVFAAINLYNKHQEEKHIMKEISELKTKNKSIKEANRKVEEKEKKQEKELAITDVLNTSSNFNDKFFVWGSWEEYSSNMKKLRELHPNLDDSNKVQIDGKDVGNGTSPKSSYDSDIFITKNKGEITELLTQKKKYEDKDTEKIWFKNSYYKEGIYDINEFESYTRIL
ncbi:hypothetical protein GH131_10535 [Staphylococcus pseudintermedius]|nr:hypothetical protein [Staphylococcus pseudintermedius]